MAFAFDPIQYIKRLTDVGVPRQQAEVQVQLMVEVVEDKVATKQDLAHAAERLELKIEQIYAETAQIRAQASQMQAQIQSEIAQRQEQTRAEIAQRHEQTRAEIAQKHEQTRAEIAQIKSDLELKISDSKLDLIKWVLAALVTQAAIIISCIKLIH